MLRVPTILVLVPSLRSRCNIFLRYSKPSCAAPCRNTFGCAVQAMLALMSAAQLLLAAAPLNGTAALLGGTAMCGADPRQYCAC